MDEVIDNFAWTHRLHCPPGLCNNSVKKILSKGVLELLWEDISNSAFPISEACKIRKNILLHKLKHGLNDPTITSIKDLNHLRSKSDALKQQISALEEEYEERDHVVRQKMQRLKDIRNRCSMISTRKDLVKLKYSETSKQLKDCSDMRRVCQHLMPNTSKDIDLQKLKENLDVVADLRSTGNKQQVWAKVSSSIGSIEVHTLWTHLYQTLSQDLDVLIKLETKDHSSSLIDMGENIDIGIARVCGQHICMTLKRILFSTKANIYQQRIIEFIELIESLCHEDVSSWLSLTLEVRKLETEQAYLQNEIQKLKDNIEENSLLNLHIAQLTADIETVDAQMDQYVKIIQQSIGILNCATSLIYKAKEKLHHKSQKILELQTDSNYDTKCLNNALDIELDMFHNILDLNALRKVMLKGDVGLYRHAICGFDKTSITTINSQCSKIKPYFPMIQMPIYCLIECYKNIMANVIYTKLYPPTPTEDIVCTIKLVPPREKCDYNSLELLNLAKIVCGQAREEIEGFNAILDAWTNQNVQEVMTLDETTVDGVSFKDWLQRYSLLLYMIKNIK